ncbi:MAG: ABC transporter substrate-binding protein [Acidobacteriota bacterium]|nr:ABC transporter substrate-binding protein [Acidobacteriota bacterium]
MPGFENGKPLPQFVSAKQWVAIAATMQHDPHAIMLHFNSPIQDFKDLNGYTIAAQTGVTWLKYVTLHYHLANVRQMPPTHKRES